MIPNILLSALLIAAPTQSPDSLDAFIRAQMAMRKIPGLSLAIVDKGKIVYAKGYGVTAPGGKVRVTTDTRFLAGSISKSVAAVGALKLVEAGTLSLDGNVNDKLTTWKVPDNGFTGTEKVTLKRILSHTTGLTVHGFGGYEVGTPVPTLTQILDGASPANSPPVRVDTTPGAFWRYSGGGYTVMQLMMDDVTGVPFDQWMATNVIGPFGMIQSSFQQPPSAAMAPFVAAGQYAPGTPVPGRLSPVSRDGRGRTLDHRERPRPLHHRHSAVVRRHRQSGHFPGDDARDAHRRQEQRRARRLPRREQRQAPLLSRRT